MCEEEVLPSHPPCPHPHPTISQLQFSKSAFELSANDEVHSFPNKSFPVQNPYPVFNKGGLSNNFSNNNDDTEKAKRPHNGSIASMIPLIRPQKYKGPESVDPRRREVLGQSPYTARTNPFLFGYHKRRSKLGTKSGSMSTPPNECNDSTTAPKNSFTTKQATVDYKSTPLSSDLVILEPQPNSSIPLATSLTQIEHLHFNPIAKIDELLETNDPIVKKINGTSTNYALNTNFDTKLYGDIESEVNVESNIAIPRAKKSVPVTYLESLRDSPVLSEFLKRDPPLNPIYSFVPCQMEPPLYSSLSNSNNSTGTQMPLPNVSKMIEFRRVEL